jgi:hypothetical protein
MSVNLSSDLAAWPSGRFGALPNRPGAEIDRCRRVSALVPIGRGAFARPENRTTQQVRAMLYTIAVILIVLWLLGLVTSYTVGGFIHVLLVIAIIMILLNIISGRRSL